MTEQELLRDGLADDGVREGDTIRIEGRPFEVRRCPTCQKLTPVQYNIVRDEWSGICHSWPVTQRINPS